MPPLSRPALSGPPVRTPLVSLGSAHGWRDLLLKDETQQRSGAFKFRGVWQRTGRYPAGTVLVTASTGNHAAALAEAAHARGQHARVYLPAATPAAKVRRVAQWGGETVAVAGGYDDCEAAARADADRGRGVFVHSFDDAGIIAGHRSLFAEAAAQGGLPDVVYLPLGGGGLITAALHEWAAAGVRIVGVEYAGAPAMGASLAAGRRVTLDSAAGLPEGLLVRRIGALAFEACRSGRPDVVSVEDHELHRAMALLWTHAGIRAEAAGAAALAAALRERGPGRRALAVVSGGNIDETLWQHCVEAARSRLADGLRTSRGA